MKNYLTCCVFFVLNVLSGVCWSQEVKNGTFVNLNEMQPNSRVGLRVPVINLTVKSEIDETLSCTIVSKGKVIQTIQLELYYGIHTYNVKLSSEVATGSSDRTYLFRYESKNLGKGSFEFYLESPPVLPLPHADITINPLFTSCESFPSNIEFLARVDGGNPPYKLTWLISQGDQLNDLLIQPVVQDLKSENEISRIVIDEPLHYYVTLMAEDACGNIAKKTLHVQCEKNDDDGMLYFQPIELKPKGGI